jgi:DNA-binding transcriptional MerR regulator
VDKAPDAFRTISEVADDLKVPQHVLRFWETRFPQIKPMKRGGGRRYYRPDDVDLLRGIRHLLYGEGYTIRGVQRLLKDNGQRFVQGVGRSDEAERSVGTPVAEEETEGGAGDGIEVVEESAETTVEAPAAPGFPAGAPTALAPRLAPEVRVAAPAPPPRPAEPSPPSLSAEDRRRLQAALYELAECRRLLVAALKDE